MARKKKNSPAEDMMELVALLPWWAGVALALLAYVLLHRVATQVVIAPLVPGQVDAMINQTLWKTVAIFGQYFLPVICLGGAAVSAIGRNKRRKLVTAVASSKALADKLICIGTSATMATDGTETVRVLKNGEMKAYGEYRTQRLVLAAWDAQEQRDLV